MNASLSEFYHKLRDESIVLAFLGVFSQEIMVECRKILTDRRQMDKNRLLVLTGVFVELTENILKYSAERELRNGKHRGVGIVVVRESATHFTIQSGNLAKTAVGEALVSHCNELNLLDAEALKTRYLSQRREARKQGATGAGLGLIEISRRADGPVQCQAEPRSEGLCFVSISIPIAK
jgi:hypothetical protein